MLKRQSLVIAVVALSVLVSGTILTVWLRQGRGGDPKTVRIELNEPTDNTLNWPKPDVTRVENFAELPAEKEDRATPTGSPEATSSNDQLTQVPGEIMGLVYDAKNERLAHRALVFRDQADLTRTVYSDSDGRYHIKEVPPGLWDIYYLGRGNRHWGRGMTNLFESVEVVSGIVSTKDIYLAGTRKISGVFKSPSFGKDHQNREQFMPLRATLKYIWSEETIATCMVTYPHRMNQRPHPEYSDDVEDETTAQGPNELKRIPGHFEIVGLKPEQYRLEISPDWTLGDPLAQYQTSVVIHADTRDADVDLGTRSLTASQFFGGAEVTFSTAE